MDYTNLPRNPQELYGMFPNGLPVDFSWQEYYNAHPTTYNPDGMDEEARIRSWIEQGRPGWDSQGRVLGPGGRVLDDFSAGLTGSIPSRLGTAPPPNPYTVPDGSLGFARGRANNTYGIGPGHWAAPNLGGTGNFGPQGAGQTPAGGAGTPPPPGGAGPGARGPGVGLPPPPPGGAGAGTPPGGNVYNPNANIPYTTQRAPVPTLQDQATNTSIYNNTNPGATNLNALARQTGNTNGYRGTTRPGQAFARRSPAGYRGY